MNDLLSLIGTLFKELVAELSTTHKVLLLALAIVSLALFLFGVYAPWGTETKVVAFSFGWILLLYIPFHAGYMYALDGLRGSRQCMSVAIPSAIIASSGGGCLYAFCIFSSAVPCPSDINIILEKFGRFILFGMGICIPSSFLICVLRHNRTVRAQASGCNPAPPERAVIAVVLAAVQFLLTIAATAMIKELSLAIPGPDMGDVNIFLQALPAFLLFSLVTRALLDRPPTFARILSIAAMASVLLALFAIALRYGSPNKIFTPGTGIGIIATLGLAAIAIVMLVFQPLETNRLPN